jgi:malonyl-CoA O-methyltransferase
MDLFTLLREKLKINVSRRQNKKMLPAEKAIEWVKTHRIPGAGIPPHHKANVAGQEGTGYLIPTLYNWGEKELARDLARWEASVQRPDGSFTGPDGVPYTFDTAQVIRGFLAVLDDMPELEDNLKRACDYVESHIAPNGEVLTPSYDTWKFSDGSMLSEYGNLYVLPPLLDAGQKLAEPRYTKAAQRGMNYFRQKADLVEFKSELSTISHYFGYMMEALVDLAEIDLARKGLSEVTAIQKKSGAIPAYPGVNWVCSTGMAQLAIAWYKLGEKEPADKAMTYLEKLQNPDGGFYGSYGKGARYFPTGEISWAVKFFLDAYLLKIKSDFNREVDEYSISIDDKDGRVREILSFFGDLNGKKVMDVGCGKGRYLRVLMNRFSRAKYYGLDISEEMLRFCQKGIETTVGSMLAMKYPDSYFDCVFSVEALEHAVNVEAAVKEMVRVLKSGGKIIIIDKDIDKLGVLKIKPWERWYGAEQITALLERYGVKAHHKKVSYEGNVYPDSLFIAWEGVKAS